MHYGQNRPYFRSIDSTSRGTLEKVPARVAARRPAALRQTLCARALLHPGGYQCHDNPMEAILLSIALDQEKRLYAVEKVLQNAGVSPQHALGIAPRECGEI